MNEQHKLFVTMLGLIQIENFVHNWPGLTGRPASDRQALARAFAAKPPRRLELQKDMTLPEMLADLPTACDVGTKRNAKGFMCHLMFGILALTVD